MRLLAALILVGVGLAAGANAAEPLARAHRVQPPVWVSSANGFRRPLFPGVPLAAGDRIETGTRARAQIALADGALIKLGEKADFRVEQLAGIDSAGERIVRGALAVLKGAFRFTTGLLDRDSRREYAVRVGVVTVGIRGTDIWGKADGAEDLVCLLDGEVTMAVGETPAVPVDQARTVVTVPEGGDPGPAYIATAQNIGRWAPQTEPVPGLGSMQAAGRWAIALGAFPDPRLAAPFANRLTRDGYPVRQMMIQVRGEDWLRVLMRGFASKADAETYRQRLQAEFGLTGLWVFDLESR